MINKKYFFFFLALFFLLPLGSILAAATLAPAIASISQDKLAVYGLTAAGTDVMIYVDDKFLGTAKINSENTATDNFYFELNGMLSQGNHTVAAVARDKKSLVLSDFSEEKEFFVPEEKKLAPAITKAAAEETAKAEQKTKDQNDLNTERLLNQEQEQNAGLIDENKEQQGKLKWNLVIFIVFLLAVIGWIFWVNRELIKEKRAEAKKENNDKK